MSLNKDLYEEKRLDKELFQEKPEPEPNEDCYWNNSEWPIFIQIGPVYEDGKRLDPVQDISILPGQGIDLSILGMSKIRKKGA